MGQGLEVYNEAGVKIFEAASASTGRIFGTFVCYWNGARNFTITDDRFLTGTPFYFFQTFNFLSDTTSNGESLTTILISGNTLTFSRTGSINDVLTTPAGILYYGCLP